MGVEIVIMAAMAENRVIGWRQTIPWHVQGEQRRFRETTWGHPLIMGRRTFESIGRPLPGRRNIVLSRDPDYRAPGCEVAAGLAPALSRCLEAERVFVIGGEQVFVQALPLADTVILSRIPLAAPGDAFFPVLGPEFVLAKSEPVTSPAPYTIEVYRRRA
ncbi:MAG: dihydrofolate reductase [Desulfobacteraceae bacterium]|nr:dihydrofolate reductase [Desulfobacteraceae bacterium]